MNTIMQQWEGVNERMVPEILGPDVFSMSVGVTWRDYNGAGRILGKTLFARLQTSIIGLGQSSTQLFVQTPAALYICELSSLLQDTRWEDEVGTVVTDEDLNVINFDI
jgi:hypothetical protein